MNLFICDSTPILEALYDFNDNMNRVINESRIINILENHTDTFLLEDVSGRLKEIKDNIIRFIKELWTRVKNWFNDIMYRLKGLFSNRKMIAKKYEKQFDENVKKEFEKINGGGVTEASTYRSKLDRTLFKDYTPFDITNICLNVCDNITEAHDKLEDKLNRDYQMNTQDTISSTDVYETFYDNLLKGINTQVTNKSRDITDIDSVDDFEKFIFAHTEYHQNYTLTREDVESIKNSIFNTDTLLNKIKVLPHNAEKTFNNTINSVNKQSIDNSSTVQYNNNIKTLFSCVINMITSVCRVCTKYVTDAYNYNLGLYFSIAGV